MKLRFCICSDYGVVGSMKLGPNGESEFAMVRLEYERRAQRLAKKLTNATKVEHRIGIVDLDTGAIMDSKNFKKKEEKK